MSQGERDSNRTSGSASRLSELKQAEDTVTVKVTHVDTPVGRERLCLSR